MTQKLTVVNGMQVAEEWPERIKEAQEIATYYLHMKKITEGLSPPTGLSGRSAVWQPED